MKLRYPSLTAYVLLFALSSNLLSANTASIGEIAPDFKLADIEGTMHNLAAYRGKTVVLEWVNPECPFVVKHYRTGNLPNMQKKATNDGVIWLSINSGRTGAQGDFDVAEVKRWTESTGASFSGYLRDRSGEVGRAYGAKTTPHIFVINPEGILVYDGAIDSIASTRDGDIEQAERYVDLALTAVKDGTVPEKVKSRPYGCSVKY